MNNELQIPGPIVDFLEAIDERDTDAFLAVFAENAAITDEGHEYHGLRAIKEWNSEKNMGADITLSPVGAVERGGKTILTAEVDGIFDRTGLPDPFLMDLYFTIDENLITALEYRLAGETSSCVSAPQTSKSAKPTVILVHGAWADGTSWHKQIGPLIAAGCNVIAVQNPTASLADDVAATLAAIDRAGGDVILVGHSWGGCVISEAGSDPRVKGLVYVAAFAPDKGESIASLNETAAPTEMGKFLLESKGGGLTLTREGVAKVFADDVSTDEQDLIFAVQPPAMPKIFTELGVNAAWKTKPSWFVVASDDKTVDPELQMTMAKRANAETTIVKAGHVPMLSKPIEVLSGYFERSKCYLSAAVIVGKIVPK